MSDIRILHGFADLGAEDPCLSKFGDVLRVTIDAQPNGYSDVIQADLTKLPFDDSAQFDLGVFHPPCGGVSPMSDTGSGSRDDWPDLIPEARDVAKQHCDHWIIENKPRDILNDPVILDGHMFQLGIEYERAFETSFEVEQPARFNRFAETSPFFYSEWCHGEWCAVKGTTTEFSKDHVAKNTIPAAYLDYLMKYYYRAVDGEERPDYSDYDKQMKSKRSKTENQGLDVYM